MKTFAILSVVLCSCMLLRVASATPVDEAEISGYPQVLEPENPEIVKQKNRDITFNGEIQSNAHIEVPGSVVQNLLKAMFEAFQKMQISSETTVQSQVHVPDVKPATVDPKPEARAFCNIGVCNNHCFSYGYRGGFCNMWSTCVCY
uniref:Defensin, isoforms B and C n=1 Tax=Zeugodacus cucurbitae TaxID=28588 RepID=A0A0A1XIF2_ZEUCU